MNFWRYKILQLVVGFGVFLITCPITFLLAGALASVMPTGGKGAAFALAGLTFLVSSVVLTHVVTEKLSKRWSS